MSSFFWSVWFFVYKTSRDEKCNFYLYIIVALYYTWLIFSFTQGGTGVPCPPLRALLDTSFAISGVTCCFMGSYLNIPLTYLAVCSGVVEGLVWGGGFDLDWLPCRAYLNRLSRRRLPTAGAWRLFSAPAPRNPGCTSVWTVPK